MKAIGMNSKLGCNYDKIRVNHGGVADEVKKDL